MKSLLRPYTYLGTVILAGAGLALVAAPHGLTAQSGVSHILRELNPLLSHAPGYLGVLVSDVDEDSYQKLRLKDRSGALITLIDHDAPAGTALHVNDVITEVNGQKIDGESQFTRVMREFPIGRKVTLVIIRDGSQQTLTLQLVDRKVMEQQAWNKMNSSDDVPPPPSGMGFSTGSGGGGGWHMSLFSSSLNVGVMVEALTAQMTDYLNLASGGVMVKQVAHRSEAALAGLKPYDIILKVGNDPISTAADWDRAMRANEGKLVSVTILRDRKQQIITIQVDSKRSKHSRVEWPGFLFHHANTFAG